MPTGGGAEGGGVGGERGGGGGGGGGMGQPGTRLLVPVKVNEEPALSRFAPAYPQRRSKLLMGSENWNVMAQASLSMDVHDELSCALLDRRTHTVNEQHSRVEQG